MAQNKYNMVTKMSVYLQGVQFEAEDVIVTAAHLRVLHQGVLDLAGDGHGLSQ
jgi:hypothetical protein